MKHLTSTIISEKTTLITVSGIFDKDTTPPVRQETLKHLEKGTVNFIFDLSLVTHVDSSGLGLLVGTLARCKERDGLCIILDPSQEVRKAIRITKLSQILTTVNTTEEAVKRIKSSGA